MPRTPTTKPRSHNTRRARPNVVAPPAAAPPPATIGELLKRLGNVPASRVRLHPTPGQATEADLIRVLDRKEGLCELVEGTLVEKPMGYEESQIACFLIAEFIFFVRPRKLGLVSGEAGPFRLFGGLVRMPDVAYVSYDRLPGRKKPRAPIPHLVPDLAVEVLSRSNTAREIERKLGEYFTAGVRLVWVVSPRKKTVRVYTAADRSVLLEGDATLDGGDVLPGFVLPLRTLFAGDET